MRLPLAGGSIDVVLLFGLLPHLPNLERGLEEALRVLRPGGVIAAGHLMSSQELNAFHASLNAPVSGDLLPSARELAGRLACLGAAGATADEKPGWYFVRAEKSSS